MQQTEAGIKSERSDRQARFRFKQSVKTVSELHLKGFAALREVPDMRDLQFRMLARVISQSQAKFPDFTAFFRKNT
jgi:hypothetical protein